VVSLLREQEFGVVDEVVFEGFVAEG